MSEKFNQIKYQNEFNKQRYDRITIVVPKGDKDIIKAHADKYDGGSVNAFIQRAIAETMARDEAKDKS
jgi:hypothetical protein